MTGMSRRNCIQGTLSALGAAAAPASAAVASTPLRKSRAPQQRGMQFAELFYPGEDHKVRLASQIGITHAIMSTSPTLGKVPRDRYLAELLKIKSYLKDAGLVFAGVESHPVPADNPTGSTVCPRARSSFASSSIISSAPPGPSHSIMSAMRSGRPPLALALIAGAAIPSSREKMGGDPLRERSRCGHADAKR